MENLNKETFRGTLLKTANWQSLLLLAMGLFYIGVALLGLGEIVTASYRSNFYYVFSSFVVVGLAWTGYIWVNLLRNILATRAYLRSSKEEDLLKSYQQQRLFWRNISIISGGFVVFVTGVFLTMILFKRF
ncbi:MAG: hypothetical protein ACRBFS_12615 [Aureispira sp.]